MGLFKKLKKAVHGVRKALHLPAITIGNVAKVAGAAAVGGPLAGAAAVLKSRLKSAAVGGVKQVVKSKAEKAIVSRIAKLAPALHPVAATISSKATARPGGAPLGAAAGAAAKLKRATHSRRRRKAKAKPIKAAGAKRRAPTGGLDLKGLSASWRAAGKPGTWQGWIAAHK